MIHDIMLWLERIVGRGYMLNLLADTDAADLSTFAMEKQTLGVVNLVSH